MNAKSKWQLLGILAVVFIGLTLLFHLSTIANLLSRAIGAILPIPVGLCIAFVLNLWLKVLERLWTRLLGEKAKRAKRPTCLVLCLLSAVGLIALLLVLVIPQILESIVGLWEKIPDYLARMQALCGALSVRLADFSISLPPLSLDSEGLQAAIGAYLEKYGHWLVGLSVDLIKTLFSIVWDGLLSIVLAIYILAQKEKLGASIKKLLAACFSSDNARRILDVAKICEESFSKFIVGQLTEAVILGGLCFLGMLLFGFPYAPLISVLIGVSALIPIFGAFIGTGIGAFLILLDAPMQALWFVVFILILQQLEGNLIYPRVVGKSVGLPGVWVLIAVTVGSSFGIVGMLLSVPLCSIAYTLLRQFCDKRLREKQT